MTLNLAEVNGGWFSIRLLPSPYWTNDVIELGKSGTP